MRTYRPLTEWILTRPRLPSAGTGRSATITDVSLSPSTFRSSIPSEAKIRRLLTRECSPYSAPVTRCVLPNGLVKTCLLEGLSTRSSPDGIFLGLPGSQAWQLGAPRSFPPQAPWQQTNVVPTESKHWFGREEVGSHVLVGTGVVEVPGAEVPGTFVELPAHAAAPGTHSGVGQHATKAPSSE